MASAPAETPGAPDPTSGSPRARRPSTISPLRPSSPEAPTIISSMRRRSMRTARPAEQFEDWAKQTRAAHLGMWVFLGSEVLLFAGFFALYAAYRAMYPADFTAAIARDNVAIGTANTFILITSSLTVVLAVHEARQGRLRWTARFLWASIAFGVAFLLLKSLEYRQHFSEGIFPGQG